MISDGTSSVYTEQEYLLGTNDIVSAISFEKSYSLHHNDSD